MRNIVLVGSKKYEEIDSLIVSEIEYHDMRDSFREIPHHTDALIFTSKNAIKSLEENLKKYPQYLFLKKIPCYVIGEGSALFLQKYGFTIGYVGEDSHGSGFASEIIPLLKHKKVVYFRAKKIVSQIPEILAESKIEVRQIVAYENKKSEAKNLVRPAPRSILIFSAPSYYASFIQNFVWDGSYIAVAIGLTTFYSFNEEIEAYVSPRQSIESCIDFAREIAMRLP